MKLLTVVLALTRSAPTLVLASPKKAIEDVVDRHRSHDVQAVIS